MDEVKLALEKMEQLVKRVEADTEMDPLAAKTLRLVLSDAMVGAVFYLSGAVAAGRPDRIISFCDHVRAQASSLMLELQQEQEFDKLTDSEKKETAN